MGAHTVAGVDLLWRVYGFHVIDIFICRVVVIPEPNRWRHGMQTVILSSKYQVVIPKNIRDALKLKPGQKMHVIEYDGRIELIPERDIAELRGFLRGIDTRLEREKDRQ